MQVSGKLDEVSRNRIWEEHVKKTERVQKINTTFCIANPSKVEVYPEKPNQTKPSTALDQATILDATARLNSLAQLKGTDMLPTQKYEMPISGNMEYGFFAHMQMVPPGPTSPMFDHPQRYGDVTAYANSYSAMTGKSLFSNPAKSPGGK